MIIASESYIAHDPGAVFEVYRDRVQELVAYLPDVAEIVVLAREEGPGTVRLHNAWRSTSEVPAMARSVVKPEHLCWEDYVTWNEALRMGEWSIKTRLFTEGVRCEGRTEILDDGVDGCLVRMSGRIDIDLDRAGVLPGFVGRRLAPQLEKFIVSLITPNLERTNQAIGRYLDERD